MDELIFDAYSIFFQLAQKCAPEYWNTLELELTTFIFSGVFILLVVAGLLAIWYCVAKLLLRMGASE